MNTQPDSSSSPKPQAPNPHRTIILFGGSFDPPHVAHIVLPMLVREAVGADAVAYVPCASQPLKQHLRQTPAEHRLAMLRLALANCPHAHILTDEIDRPGPSYTIDTLETLQKKYPTVRWRLLIGLDQAAIFPKWKMADRIVAVADPIMMRRAGKNAVVPDQWANRVIDVPPMEISSTTIRVRVLQGLSIAGLAPPPVVDYIRRHGLYAMGESDELS